MGRITLSHCLLDSQSWEDSRGARVNKVGVNTRKSWGNPRGIYAYWASDVIKNTHAHFMRGADMAYIIQKLPLGNQITDIGSLNDDEYDTYIDKLKKYIIRSPEFTIKSSRKFNDVIKYVCNTSRHSDNKGGILFNLIVLLSERYTASNRTSDLIQTQIWRSALGVTFIGDRGHGIIHPNEPDQAVFLDPRAYKVVTRSHNQKPGNYDEILEQLDKDGFDVLHSISNMSDDKSYKYLTFLVHKQPDAVKRVFVDHPTLLCQFNSKCRAHLYHYTDYGNRLAEYLVRNPKLMKKFSYDNVMDMVFKEVRVPNHYFANEQWLLDFLPLCHEDTARELIDKHKNDISRIIKDQPYLYINKLENFFISVGLSIDEFYDLFGYAIYEAIKKYDGSEYYGNYFDWLYMTDEGKQIFLDKYINNQ